MFKGNRSMVEAALEKAARYEREGNRSRAEYFLQFAEKAEEIYDKYSR